MVEGLRLQSYHERPHSVGCMSSERSAASMAPSSLMQMRERLAFRLASPQCSPAHSQQLSVSEMQSSARSAWSGCKVLPPPALYTSPRAEDVYKTTGMPYILSDSGLHTAPWARSCGSKPFKTSRHDSLSACNEEPAQPVEMSGKMDPALPLEKPTAEVLERIFPVKLKELPKRKIQKAAAPKGLAKARATVAIGFPRKASLGEDDPSPGGGSKAFLRKSCFAGEVRDGSAGESSPKSIQDVVGQGKNRRYSAMALEQSRDTGRNRLLEIRSILLSRFENLNEAFQVFLGSTGDIDKGLPSDQFSRFLKEHIPEIEREDYSSIFDFLDKDNNRAISVIEFQMACEACPPVNKLEDLRLKWIAMGYKSMRQVIDDMELSTRRRGARHNTFKRLSMGEFDGALSSVGIELPEEVHAIFTALTKLTGATTVSIAELGAALAALGPPLLLEHVRRRLLSNFKSLEKAASMFVPDDANDFFLETFVDQAVANLKVTQQEAVKLFCMIDVNSVGLLSKVDFIRAFRLVEPGLFLETARRKLRQRWRSVQEAFALHQYELDTFGIALRPRDELDSQALEKAKSRGLTGCTESDFKNLLEMQSILASIGLPETDIAVLFKCIDVDGGGRLMASEFAQSVRLCTPSGTMEDMRLRCLECGASVWDVLDRTKHTMRSKVLDKKEFLQVVKELDLAKGVNADLIFDLLDDSREGGGLLINELVVALETAAPGSQVPLKEHQLASKATQQVNELIGSVLKNTQEHRHVVRKRMTHDTDTVAKNLPLGHASDPSSFFCSSLFWQKTYAHPHFYDPIRSKGPSYQRKESKSAEAEQIIISRPNTANLNNSWTAPSLLQKVFDEQKLDLNAFSPTLDRLKLPASRQRQRALAPPQWTETSHRKLKNLLGTGFVDPGEFGEVIMQNMQDYYSNAGQTLAADKQSLEESPVSPYQQFKNMKAAELACRS